MIPVLIGFFVYSIIHSVLASRSIKHAIRDRIGERAYHGFYRLFYNAIAGITIVPILLLIVFRPGDIVWSLSLDWEPVLFIIQAVGLLGLIVSLLQIDLLRFAGLTQAWAFINKDPLPLPDEKLQTQGIYRFVRHPLYLFSMMVIWPVTTMTEAYLGFCIGATAYFFIGSWYEERRMVQLFGDEYIRYQKRVPWLLPLPRFGDKP